MVDYLVVRVISPARLYFFLFEFGVNAQILVIYTHIIVKQNKSHIRLWIYKINWMFANIAF